MKEKNKIKITLNRLTESYNSVTALLKGKISTKLSFVLIDNKRLWQAEIDSIAEKQGMLAGLDTFQKLRVDICKELANRDSNNKPILINNNYDIPADKMVELNRRIAELAPTYKDAFEAEAEFKEHLKQEIEIEYFKIPQSLLPKEIFGGHLESLLDIIDRDN